MLLFVLTCMLVAPSPTGAQNSTPGTYLNTPRGHLYYEREGSGPPVILIAGGPGDSLQVFHPWFSRLAASNTVIYLDNVGRGRSDRLPSGTRYTIAGDVRDVEYLRRALGFKKFAVLGFSAGGLIAAGYAETYPSHVSALIFSDAVTSARQWNFANRAWDRYLEAHYPLRWARIVALRREGLRSSSPELLRYYMAPRVFWFDPSNAAKLSAPSLPDLPNERVVADEIGDDPMNVVTGTAAGFDPIPALQRLRVPVLVCAGSHDFAVAPDIARDIAGSFRVATTSFVLFSHSGHRPFIEERDRYFQVVSSFLVT